MAKVQKLAAMVLTSPLKVNGGLNCVVAGNINVAKGWPSYNSSIWLLNARETFCRAHILENLDENLKAAEQRHDTIERAADVGKLEKRNANAEKRVKDLRLSILSLKEAKEKAVIECEELDVRVLN